MNNKKRKNDKDTPKRNTKKRNTSLQSQFQQQFEEFRLQQEEKERIQREENQRQMNEMMQQMKMQMDMQMQMFSAIQNAPKENPTAPTQNPPVPSAGMVNTQPEVNYSTLEDLMSQSADENQFENLNTVAPSSDQSSTSQTSHQHISSPTSENGHQHDSSGEDINAPGPSGLSSQRSRSQTNYYETPEPTNSRRPSALSPTSPTLLEYHKKNAKIHKKRLSEAQLMNITIYVNLNYTFGAGRRAGFRKAKGQNARQPFRTRSKSELIKEYYCKYFPELVNEWGSDFDKICPIKPADTSTWLRNISLYGSIERKENRNLPEPPNPARNADQD